MVPMLLDINASEFVLLAVVAVILFGPEKLPEFARKAAQALHYVRGLAGNAQEQLKSELGPEFSNMDFRDLNPKEFVRKHLLEDVDPIIADVKDDLNAAAGGSRGIFADLQANLDETRRPGRLTQPAMLGAGSAAAVVVPWDRDAT